MVEEYAYLADIFMTTNELNLTIREKYLHIHKKR
jgi:hypothetical protein